MEKCRVIVGVLCLVVFLSSKAPALEVDESTKQLLGNALNRVEKALQEEAPDDSLQMQHIMILAMLDRWEEVVRLWRDIRKKLTVAQNQELLGSLLPLRTGMINRLEITVDDSSTGLDGSGDIFMSAAYMKDMALKGLSAEKKTKLMELCKEGTDFFTAGKIDEGIAKLEEASVIGNKAYAYLFMGALLSNVQRISLAIKYLEEGIASAPKGSVLPNTYVILAMSYAGNGDMQKAKETLKTELTNNPGNSLLLMTLATLYLLGQEKEAYLTTCEQVQHSDPITFAFMEDAYLRQKKAFQESKGKQERILSEWKKSTPKSRGELFDFMEFFNLLKDKKKQDVIAILGKADIEKDDGSIGYLCETSNFPDKKYIVVCFSPEDKMTTVKWDDGE